MLASAQVNGAGAPQSGAADCSALCPSASDVMCRIRNKCWRSLLGMSAGIVGLLAGGCATPAIACPFLSCNAAFSYAVLLMYAEMTQIDESWRMISDWLRTHCRDEHT